MIPFAELVPEAQKQHLRRHSFRRGEAILCLGDDNLQLYAVESGAAVGYIEDRNGRAAPVDRYGPGDIFGELEIFVDGLRSIGITATEPCVVHTLRKEHLLAAMEADFSFTLRIVAHLAERMRSYSANATLLQLMSVRERVAKCLLMYSDTGALPSLQKRDLAVAAKAPVRSVNRALAALSAAGLIEISHRQIGIADRERLFALCGAQSGGEYL